MLICTDLHMPGMPDARLYFFSFPVWILNPARHGDRAVVCKHIAIEWVESGIVNVRDEHAFAQVVEHHDASGTTQAAKGFG